MNTIRRMPRIPKQPRLKLVDGWGDHLHAQLLRVANPPERGETWSSDDGTRWRIWSQPRLADDGEWIAVASKVTEPIGV